MQSTHIANMNLTTLSSAATIGHVIPSLSSASLLSIGQLCDNNCLALFTKEKVFIFTQNKLILQGKRCHKKFQESLHCSFPLQCWCRLLTQVELTINLLRLSRLNPRLSVYDNSMDPSTLT